MRGGRPARGRGQGGTGGPVGAADTAAAGRARDRQTIAAVDRPRPAPRKGERPAERIPVILEIASVPEYALIDSGEGSKLERYGSFRIVRPEAQALWLRGLAEQEWSAADAVFTGDTDEDGIGRWHFPVRPLDETWPMSLCGVRFLARLTSFRHVGVFPEQIAHWEWMREAIASAGRPVRVLNLFGYTGVASLVAAAAGAEVTHVDASKKAIGWARENQDLAGLSDRPIRWICDDASKFVAREARRGNSYDIILADPPKFGRGPGGEVWQLFDDLPHLLDGCRDLLRPDSIGFVLTAYSIRASFYSIHELMRETMRGAGGVVESGELILREASRDRALSTSLFSRWVKQ